MITIGVPTYNRLKIIKKMAASLYNSNLYPACHIRVYDDCSTEFSMDILRAIFSKAASFYRQPKNMGADYNTYCMYKDFLNTNDKFFFNADSDLIFSSDWLNKAFELLPQTDGILSIFNTRNHRIIFEEEKLCEKVDLGAAGTLFTRERVEEIVKEVSRENRNCDALDWWWSMYMRRNGKRLFSTKESYVQHIGFSGQNSSVCNFDYGTNFVLDTVENGLILNNLLEEYIHAAGQECKKRCRDYQVGKYILNPLRFIKHRILRGWI